MHLQTPTADTDEWDLLTTALNQYGIRHVAPGAKPKGPLPKSEELFFHLATSHAVRLRQAMILMLITHPDLDADARQAIERLGGDLRTKALYRYVAACALQRTWRTRLATDLGPRRPIQPVYLDRLALPPLDQDAGRATLVALSNQEEDSYRYDAWNGYTALMDLLLSELGDPRWGKVHAGVR